MTVVTDYTSILYAADGEPNITWNGITGMGAPVIVTYSFVDGADLADWEAISDYANDGYTAMTTAQRANFQDALALFEQAAGIVFVRVASGHGMINAMNTSGSDWGGWAATAYSTTTYTGSGEVVIDDTGNYDEGSKAFQTILHELGHAMGLQHPWEGEVTLAPSLDDQWHTVMTYNGSSTNAEHLGTLDVSAMQALYGDAAQVAGWVLTRVGGVQNVTGTARGDNILGVAGANWLNGAGGRDTLHGRQDNDTLIGGGRADDLAGNGGSDMIYGNDGDDALWGFEIAPDWAAGNDSLFGGDGSDTLTGGGNDDRLFGGKGLDLLYGGAGWDTLLGGRGADVFYGGGTGAGDEHFTGGAGADRFVLLIADGASHIYLTDFTLGQDKIDLSDLGVGFGDVIRSEGWLNVGDLSISTAAAQQVTATDFVF